VVVMIISLTILLFAIGTAFSVGLFEAKKQIGPLQPASIQNPVDTSSLDLKNLDLGGTPAGQDIEVETSTPPINVTPTK